MEKLSQEIINWVRTEDKRVVIGIAGHGVAGKTTFANKLKEQFMSKRSKLY